MTSQVSSLASSEHTATSNWKLVLAYDGGAFSGWQVQPGRLTVQGSLAHALERVTGEQVLPQGSGRTDAGVHALAQVASFRLRAPIPAASLLRALNRALPASVRVLSAETAPDHFHARHSALSKWYEYRLWRGELCPPWTAPYVYACNWPLDLHAMQLAASMIVGLHDFRSFAASDPDLAGRTALKDQQSPQASPSCVRRVETSLWEQAGPDLLRYQVQGSGFLHHMVRNLVGTLLAIGRGQLAPSDVPRILAARNRSAAGPTAPAQGLFLASVEYAAEPAASPQVLP